MLRRAIEDYYKGALDYLTHRLWRGEQIPPEEIAGMKMFYEGALFVVTHPEEVERKLEQAAQEAWQRYVQQEVESTEPGLSPYE